ncbi:MAG: hypothetical protein WEB30_07570 [Cyclobacteriaceae bacterium]
MYYLTGFFIALIIHVIIGWEYKVLMPRSFAVIILLALAGLPWAFLNISNLLCPLKRPQNLAELVSHIFFLLLISVVAVKVW